MSPLIADDLGGWELQALRVERAALDADLARLAADRSVTFEATSAPGTESATRGGHQVSKAAPVAASRRAASPGRGARARGTTSPSRHPRRESGSAELSAAEVTARAERALAAAQMSSARPQMAMAAVDRAHLGAGLGDEPGPSVCKQLGGTAPQCGLGGPTSSGGWSPHAPHEAMQMRIHESRVKHQEYTVVDRKHQSGRVVWSSTSYTGRQADAARPATYESKGGEFCASTSMTTKMLLGQRAEAGKAAASAVGARATSARVEQRATQRAAQRAAAGGGVARSYEPALK